MTDYAAVKTMEKRLQSGRSLCCDRTEIDDSYMEALKSQVIHWDAIKEVGKDLKIVYSPLHGTGNIPAKACAEKSLDLRMSM